MTHQAIPFSGKPWEKRAESTLKTSLPLLRSSTLPSLLGDDTLSLTIISEAQSLPARSSGEFCSSVDYLTLWRKVLKNNTSKYLLKTVKTRESQAISLSGEKGFESTEQVATLTQYLKNRLAQSVYSLCSSVLSD